MPNPQSRRISRLVTKLTDNIPLVLGIYAVTLALASWIYSHAEHLSLSDSFEWAYQTSLTIGYGDFPPHTANGRLIACIFGHIWVWGIVPLIIANIVVHAIHNKDEYTHSEQEWVGDALMALAAAQKVDLPPRPADTHLGDLNAEGELD